MNGIDLERFDELKREYYHTMGKYFPTDSDRLLRRDNGHRLTKLAVIHVCRTVMDEGLCDIAASAFSKRIGRRYRRLVIAKGIPNHDRPKLTVRGMERLIAFVCGLPKDIRYEDALEDVFVFLIEYMESEPDRRLRG